MEPPDPFPNSEVKRLSADGSVVRPCESRSSSAPYFKPLFAEAKGGFVWGVKSSLALLKFFRYRLDHGVGK